MKIIRERIIERLFPREYKNVLEHYGLRQADFRSRSQRRFNFINRNCCLYLAQKGARLIVIIPTSDS